MTRIEIENKLANSYLTLMQNFSDEVKLEFISKISLSLIKKEVKPKSKVSPEEYYAGIWQSEETPEEFAESLRKARFFNRKPTQL